ncbi:hypothetical protein KO361_00650 [Candidatus Woesearchaeota archaeon]|nr:hypothetical protein [Candidatus Woesearchaeota archaeon]
MVDKWPLYFSDNLYLSNPESETGILCLWTKKERLIEKLNPDLYSFIGQLYSKDYGVMVLLRNLLAKNDLRNLVMVGIDLNGSGKVISSFFYDGVDSNGKILGTETYLDKDVLEHVDLLRERINFVDLTNKKFDELNDFLLFDKRGAFGDCVVLDLPSLEPPKRLPTDFSGFKARGLDFTTAYKILINFVLKFGVFNDVEKKLKVWNVTLVAKRVSGQDKQFLGSKKNVLVESDSFLSNKYFDSFFFKKFDAWNSLQELARVHDKDNSLNVVCFELFIDEADLESAYELVGSIPDSQVWDQDPHGSLLVRVEDDLIKVTHLDVDGVVLEEFCADNSKSLFKKLIDDNKVSLLYHALDIGGEIKRAEDALKRNMVFVQDKK